MSTASSHLDIPAIRTEQQIHLFILYVTDSQKVCYSNKEETVRPLLRCSLSPRLSQSLSLFSPLHFNLSLFFLPIFLHTRKLEVP